MFEREKRVFSGTFSLFALGEHIIADHEYIFTECEYKNAHGEQSLYREKRQKIPAEGEVSVGK